MVMSILSMKLGSYAVLLVRMFTSSTINGVLLLTKNLVAEPLTLA